MQLPLQLHLISFRTTLGAGSRVLEQSVVCCHLGSIREVLGEEYLSMGYHIPSIPVLDTNFFGHKAMG